MKTTYECSFGMLEIEYENDVITRLFVCSPIRATTPEELKNRNTLTDTVQLQVEQYFHGERKTFDFPYQLQGTRFQLKVWHALQDIPYGETRTYKQIAEMIGNPKASRAVGMANNKNPLLLVVPCHRVIGTNGSLTGYAGGLDIKEYLLEVEKRCE